MYNKKTRIEYIYDIFTQQYERSLKKDKLIQPNQEAILKKYIITDETTNLTELCKVPYNTIDISFVNFYIEMFGFDRLINSTYKDTGLVKDAIFQYFLDHDPSYNKEYVSWFINLYADLCKSRPQITQSNKTGDNFSKKTLVSEKLFFEDFGKISDALVTFDFIKKTKILNNDQKDINNYKTYHDFINTIKPYMVDDKDDESNSIHTLSPSEIKCIQNMVNGEENPPLAELVFESDKWVIVITHDKESNVIFGKNTTWCTAGTRYMNLFDNYNKQGPLFVMIKKGYGSRKAILKDPGVRLQFHFETNQYMDAEDKPIDMSDFLLKNKDIKEFFRPYIAKAVRKKMMSNDKGNLNYVIEFLTKLGYIDELIPILRDSKAEVLDLKEVSLGEDVINRIGEITTLKTLNLSDCKLTKFPDFLSKLTNLVNLNISKNKGITFIPEFINQLVNLENLDLSWCDIKDDFEIGGLTKLKYLLLDCNQKLEKLPNGFDKCKNLKRISASCCAIKEIPDSILTLPELFMLDFHQNPNLHILPDELTAMEKILAVNLDRCGLSIEKHETLKKHATSKKIKCTYVYYMKN